jgi:CRISPR-associated protein Cmr2
MKHLFLFTISPVQSFIAQARKTQDLYAGSRILSDLIIKAIESVGKENVIFPYVRNEELRSIESLPNRFIAEIDKPENELAEFGKAVQRAVKTKFKQLADDIFTKTLRLNKETTHKNLYEKFTKQITQHLDIHWLFLPFTDETYAEKFKEIEQLLGAIKNTRTFEQNAETGRKCSVDGERNALFFGKDTNEAFWNSEKWNLSSGAIELENTDDVKVAKGEGLSAVSLTKRFYDNSGFPSTAEIALMDSLSKIEEQNITEFKKVFGKNNILYQAEKEGSLKIDGKDWKEFNEHFYYEENLNNKLIPCKKQLDLAQKQHQKLKNAFKEAKQDFIKYYALIAFDADSMGEWLSGERIKDKTQLRTFHEKLSVNLLAFGKEAKAYLDSDSNGRAVYAGGDDFIGFVNLKNLFPVMRELRQLFKKKVSDKVQSFFKNPTEEITFSAGVVVAHYKMPLGETLNWARKMEKEAKDLQGKNAFAIAVLKKSGEILQAKSKWQDEKGNFLTDSFDYLYKELEKGKDSTKKEGFSPTFIKSLNRELDIFEMDLRKTQAVPLLDMILTETKRLTERSCNLTGKKAKQDAIIDFNAHLKLLFENSKYAESKVNNFLQTLNLSDFLTRKISQD